MKPTAVVFVVGLAFAGTAVRAVDPPGLDPSMVIDFTGRIDAVRAEIRPRVNGYVTEVRVKEGQTVKKGDVLVELDPRAYKAELAVARAKLVQAEAEAKHATATLARIKRLVQTGGVGQDELLQAEASEAKAAAGVVLAKAEIERAELLLAGTRLTAPMDGRVGPLSAAVGTLVTDAGPAVATVIRTDVLSVVFDVDERSLLKLRRAGYADPTKLRVAVGLADEDTHPHAARLESIAPEVDPKAGTVRFRASLPNPKDMFSPGMFVRVRLSLAEMK